MGPLEFAKAIINFGMQQGFPVSNLRLQRLMYLCQLHHYSLKGTPLIKPNYFEAGSLGPIIREVYVEFCLYGGMPIDNWQITDVLLDDNSKAVIKPRLDIAPGNLASEVLNDLGAGKEIYRKNQKLIIPEILIQAESCLHDVLQL